MSGLGTSIPRATRFVTGLPQSVLFVAGTLLVAGLAAKEVLIRSTAVRQTITFIVFMSVDWFTVFCQDAILKPLVEIMHRIG
ncbi:MAG TPA: hypothetical protein VHG32_11525 [Thermoanaerobaculia bacterium]|jgi:hypothetical protein|nr:hypothetical protein [Thermoanaerobaculia bacterium]